MRRWVCVPMVLALLVWTPVPASRAAQSVSTKVPAKLLSKASSQGPATFSQDPVKFRRALEQELMGFVRHNYPSRVGYVVRSLQNREGKLNRDLSEATHFLLNLAQGPVTLEGIWKEWGGRPRFLLVNTVRGVRGSPQAVVSFTTYPGLLRPFTIVQVDEDGDGKADQTSTALCRCETLKEWISQNLPQTRIS